MQTLIATSSIRLDKFLSSQLTTISRNQIEIFIKTVGVTINGKHRNKSSYKLKENDKISFEFKEFKEKRIPPKVNFDIEILYEDDDLLVINKPTNLVVHPAPSVKEVTVVDWLKTKSISLSTISAQERHGIVHRLDKETTGAMVIAKTNEAHAKLSAQLEDKTMGRYYLALIDIPLKEDVVVQSQIGRSPNNRIKMANLPSGGKYSKSQFIKIRKFKNYELILAKLYTGRTHQIRVHLTKLSRHILGDTTYGYRQKNVKRVMLHAYSIYFIHPTTNEQMNIKAPLYEDFESYLV